MSDTNKATITKLLANEDLADILRELAAQIAEDCVDGLEVGAIILNAVDEIYRLG